MLNGSLQWLFRVNTQCSFIFSFVKSYEVEQRTIPMYIHNSTMRWDNESVLLIQSRKIRLRLISESGILIADVTPAVTEF